MKQTKKFELTPLDRWAARTNSKSTLHCRTVECFAQQIGYMELGLDVTVTNV